MIAVCGGETFKASGAKLISPGFTAVMPWRSVANDILPTFQVGIVLQFSPQLSYLQKQLRILVHHCFF